MSWFGRVKKRGKLKEQQALPSPFTADAPISQPDQDLLGRGEFASQLSELFASWKSDQSLIVALRGSWGEGKSSLKNLVLHSFKDRPHPPRAVQFNPWRYGDSQSIATAFYDEVAVAIGATGNPFFGFFRAKAFRAYGQLLTPVSEGLKVAGTHLPSIVTWITSLGLLTVGATTILKGLPVASVAGWILGIAGALGVLGKALQGLAGMNQHDKPLEVVRSSLEKKLKKLQQPILVIIDDIDRLEPEEIRTVFRHVKANADFPNITYLLLYQRDIVERALDAISGNEGRAYLDKIVQAAFDLPVVDHSRVLTAFGAALERLLSGYLNAENGFDPIRWSNVFQGGIKHYLDNLRDVHRLVASLTVHLEMHRGTRVLEVNVIDFVAIETLRLFEPDVFAAIAGEKALMTGLSSFDEARSKLRLEGIVARAPEQNRETVEDMIQQMFPPAEHYFRSHQYSGEFVAEWKETRRICTESYFDRYFSLRLADDSISDSEMIEILDQAGDATQLANAIADIRERKLLVAFFRCLDDMKKRLPLEKVATLLPAMMEAAEHFDEDQSFGIGSPAVSAWRSASWYVRQEKDPDKRGQIVLDAMRKTDAITVAATLIGLDMDRRAKGKAADEMIFTDAQLEYAKGLWSQKFKLGYLVNANAVLADHRFVSHLFTWRNFGHEDDARSYVSALLHKPDTFIPTLKSFRAISTSQAFGDRMATVHRRLRLSSVVAFIEFDRLKKIAAECDQSTLDEEGRALVNQVLKATSPDDSFDDDDD